MRCFGMLLDGRAQATGIRQRGRQATLLIVINDHHDLVEFTLPECPGGDTWSLLIDTNITDNSEHGSFKVGDSYGVTARSLLVFALQADSRSCIYPCFLHIEDDRGTLGRWMRTRCRLTISAASSRSLLSHLPVVAVHHQRILAGWLCASAAATDGKAVFTSWDFAQPGTSARL